MEKKTVNQSIIDKFGACARTLLPDLDVHQALAPLLEYFAIDEMLEALRDHCIRMDAGQGTPWYMVAEGIEQTLEDL